MTPADLCRQHDPIAVKMAHAAARLFPDGTDADDLCQVARLAMWRAAETWRPDIASFPTYAGRAVSMALQSARRDAHRRAAHCGDLTDEEWSAQEAAPDPSLLEVRELLDGLHPAHRRILTLCAGRGGPGWPRAKPASRDGALSASAATGKGFSGRCK